jgi:hypothetical protein
MAATLTGADQMKRIATGNVIAIAIVCGIFAGCAGRTLKPEEQSGYLKDYSNVTETRDANGSAVYRYINPRLDREHYSAVLIEPTVYYPRPEPTEQLTRATMDEIASYLDSSLSQTIGEKVKVVDKAGPGVVRMNVAITALVPEKKGLAPYQFIPVAFVVAMGTRAVIGQPEEARLVIESRGIDSVSGETLFKGVRIGTGDTLRRIEGKRVVEFEDVKPLIDKWARGVSAQVTALAKVK